MSITYQLNCSKARRTSYALLRSLKSNNPHFLVQMFKTYVLPILEFGTPIFNPHYRKDIENIEKVQRSYLKNVYKRTYQYRRNQYLSIPPLTFPNFLRPL